MEGLTAFLAGLNQQGISLWTENENLRFRAPKGAMTPAIREELRQRKAEILALLRRTGAEPIQRVADQEDYAPSRAQQRLWVLSQDQSRAAAYNIPLKLLLVGPLREDAFAEALTALVDRHESLRTSFALRDAALRQRVHRLTTVPLTRIDLTKQPAPDTEVDRLAREEALRPFDLGEAPLFRTVLVKLDPLRHVLLLTVHHIVCDGWSLGVMMRDFSALYQRACSGAAPDLPHLAFQYRDYAHWHDRLIENDGMASHRRYWLETLNKPLPVLDLPADFPRQPVLAVRGAAVESRFDRETTERLRALCRQHDASLFIGLTAIVNALLHRYTGETDILVGSPVAGRMHADLADQIGLYLNTIVLRNQVRSDEPFDELLHRVKAAATEAYEHESYPFDLLVDEVEPPREAGHSILFDVSIILQVGDVWTRALEGMEFHHLPTQVSTTKFDLTFDFVERENGLHLGIEYNTGLFAEPRVRRMATHLRELVAGILENPRQHVGLLPLTSAAERQDILARQRRSDAPDAAATLVQAIEAQVSRSPTATAVCFGTESLTYEALNRRANQLARYLQSRGVGPEVPVGICVTRSLDLVVGLLGILKAGGFYVPLDPGYPKERLELMASDSGIALLVTHQSRGHEPVAASVPRVDLDTDWLEIASYRGDNLETGIAAANAAYTIYTSGSTGGPKGVQISHGSLLNLLYATSREPGLSADDVFLAVTTISFDIAALELYLPLVAGARLIVCPTETAADGSRLLELLDETHPTAMQATPAGWQMLIHAGWNGNPELKILCGGEALSPHLAHQLVRRGASCWNLYGPTETTIWSAAGRVRPARESNDDSTDVTIGPELRNTRFYVLDQSLQLLPVGVPGELHIGGEGLARGYVGQPALTAERFVPNPFGDGDRLYKTGDLVELRPDGLLRFIGRRDGQVKLRGYRIEIGDIESALSGHPAVHQVAVTVHAAASGDPQLVAYVVPSAEGEDLTTDLRMFLESRLPRYMVPAMFVLLDAMPLTPARKIDRRRLPAPAAAVTQTFVAARNDTERVIADVWQSVLNLERLGIFDNFFELGGNSLKGTAAVATIARTLGTRLTITDLLREPTIEGLARLCRMHAGTTYSAIPRLDDEEATEPAPAATDGS